MSEYCARLGLDAETLTRLRSLCWMVHSRSDLRHLEMDESTAPDPARLRGSLYLGLLEEDLSRCREAG